MNLLQSVMVMNICCTAWSWWDPSYMSKQSGFVLFFLFPRRERELPIRHKVTRHVKEFVFIVEFEAAPTCRCNVRGFVTCPDQCLISQLFALEYPSSLVPVVEEEFVSKPELEGSSFEVDWRSRAFVVGSCKGEVTLFAGAENSQPNKRLLAGRLVGNRFIATSSSSDGKKKGHSTGKNRQCPEKTSASVETHEILISPPFSHPGRLNCIDFNQTAHSKSPK